MPHEPAVRRWLRQQGSSPEDCDDLVQEAYAKLAALQRPEQIVRADAYFFQIVRHLRVDQLRRLKIVRIESVQEIEAFSDGHDTLSPERIVGDRDELSQVLRLIAALPPRCAEILRLRKIEGLSQREIALKLGVSESIVENDAGKGLASILQAMRQAEASRKTEKGRRR